MTLPSCSSRLLEQHLLYLCDTVGVRLAGTLQEEAAANYVAEQFKEAGASVWQEQFPVKSRWVSEQQLEVLVDGAWQSFSCSLFSSTPGTNGETVEAPLVFFEAPTEYGRPDLSNLTGKAVVHLGSHIESRDAYRRLMEARPAFLLFVDIRHPGLTPLADGMFPAYTRDLGSLPTVNVAFMDAWNWRVSAATAARLTVAGGMRDSTSRNVVAELPGSNANDSVIFLGAHHDTQADSVGSDDNASGVAGILELARILAPVERERTLRLISFGAEEQLSVGSAHYVRDHRADVTDHGVLILNLDSYGSWMGWTELTVNGPPELEDYARPFFNSRELYVKTSNATMPYADHFPFVAAGIPGITLMRPNFTGGRFFHHRPDDDMTRVSVDGMAHHIDAVAAIVADLAVRPDLPFASSVPDYQAAEISQYWVDLFNGWDQ